MVNIYFDIDILYYVPFNFKIRNESSLMLSCTCMRIEIVSHLRL
jgi:hypothetical protein